MVFGRFGSVANELHSFVSAQVRLLTCYGPLPGVFLRFRSCSFSTVWKGCERTVFSLPELGLCLAFSDPSPTSFLYMSLSRLGCPTFFAHLPRSVSGLSCNGFDARPLVS